MRHQSQASPIPPYYSHLTPICSSASHEHFASIRKLHDSTSSRATNVVATTMAFAPPASLSQQIGAPDMSSRARGRRHPPLWCSSVASQKRTWWRDGETFAPQRNGQAVLTHAAQRDKNGDDNFSRQEFEAFVADMERARETGQIPSLDEIAEDFRYTLDIESDSEEDDNVDDARSKDRTDSRRSPLAPDFSGFLGKDPDYELEKEKELSRVRLGPVRLFMYEKYRQRSLRKRAEDATRRNIFDGLNEEDEEEEERAPQLMFEEQTEPMTILQKLKENRSKYFDLGTDEEAYDFAERIGLTLFLGLIGYVVIRLILKFLLFFLSFSFSFFAIFMLSAGIFVVFFIARF
ncbi:hypothetical protein FVE85_9227 [Porphyridium purpureum]|uniref:Uncharacterized protein n=1 Tax=Porphyridium purpureum TaxID=35688 RepID=A0A5J4YP38_PORPP|nr:hypothetical protein FVE85_9227 [Porphyridium purpureum]|eukprot:POR3420..scf222_8